MADVGAILAKVRALGADVVLQRGSMTIVGTVHLNNEQRAWLVGNRAAIEAHLHLVGGAGGRLDASQPHEWGDFAHVLYAECPEGVDQYDWSWFVMTAGKIVRGEPEDGDPGTFGRDEAETLQ